MKRFKLALLAMSAVAGFIAAGCDDGDSGTKAIVVSDADALKQTVYADSSEGTSKVVFTTTDAWTSSVSEVTGTGNTRMNLNNPGEGESTRAADWISISPSEGKAAGNYTVSISVEPNTTGNSRTAKIDIICGDDRITIEVTQSPDKEDGTPMGPTLEELMEECAMLIEQYEELYLDAEAIFFEIDNQYGTLASRQTVTASTPVLYEFFNEAYKVIRIFNYLKENIDILTDLSEYEKAVIKGKATMYRGAVYFYLNTLFGGVQLAASADPDENLPRSTAQEVRNFIIIDLDQAFVVVPSAKANESRLFKLKLLMAQSGYASAAETASAMIDSGTLAFEDTNGDGMTTMEDIDALVFVQTYLLAAEIANESGDMNKAIGYVNIVYSAFELPPVLSQGADAAQIRLTIRNTYNQWNKGVKFLNNIRWSGEDWGKYSLLPIPQNAMNVDGNLTQNPGW